MLVSVVSECAGVVPSEAGEVNDLLRDRPGLGEFEYIVLDLIA